MARICVWFGAAVFAIVASYLGAYWTYRAVKLKILEPRNLTASIVWSGSNDAQCTLLLVGDSRIARWPLAAPKGWRVGKLGFPGEAAVNIAPSIRQVLAHVRANVALVQAGGNDATAATFLRGDARSQLLARARHAVLAVGETARQAGVNQVIILTLVPPIDPPIWKRLLMGSTQSDLIMTLGHAIATEARARDMIVLDANALFRDQEGKLIAAYRSDSLHWSVQGYRALDKSLWKIVDGCANHRK